jgi:hypothetical protein
VVQSARQAARAARHHRRLTGWYEADRGDAQAKIAVTETTPIAAVHSSGACVLFTLNSIAIRFFAPRRVDKTELFWINPGYARDTEEQSQMRVMQSEQALANRWRDRIALQFSDRPDHGREARRNSKSGSSSSIRETSIS